jgi:S1-C subfamily serine protease
VPPRWLTLLLAGALLLVLSGCDVARIPGQAVAPTPTQAPPTPVPPTPVPPTSVPAPTAAPAPRAVLGFDTVDVYKRVSPGVVLVTSSIVRPDFFQQATPPQQGVGSGFIIDGQGHIVTNNHVVEEAERLEVSLPDNSVVPARLIGRDPWFDIAVIKVDVSPERLHQLTLGDSDAVEIGELAIAIGNPFGLERTVTTGIVSARRATVDSPGGTGVLVDAIQTDASINPGNSGGPLLNARGEVIGVNTLARLIQGVGQAGINFAIPINAVKRIAPELIAAGTYNHPFLGVGTVAITESIATELSLLVREGLIVQSVTPGSGAASAGIRPSTQPRQVRSRELGVGGDIIVAVDGRPMPRSPDLLVYLERYRRPGDTVTLTVNRDGQTQDIPVRVGDRPLAQR